jgi:hypothetical protein
VSLQAFEVTGEVTRADVTYALRAFPKLNGRRRTAFGVGLLLSPIFYLFYRGPAGIAAVGTAIVLTTLLTVGLPWVWPLRAGRALGIGLSTTWGFDPHGITQTSARGTWRATWPGVRDLRLDQDGGALLVETPTATVVPLPRGMSREQVGAVHRWWRTGESATIGRPADPAPDRIVARGTVTPAHLRALARLGRSWAWNARRWLWTGAPQTASAARRNLNGTGLPGLGRPATGRPGRDATGNGALGRNGAGSNGAAGVDGTGTDAAGGDSTMSGTAGDGAAGDGAADEVPSVAAGATPVAGDVKVIGPVGRLEQAVSEINMTPSSRP